MKLDTNKLKIAMARKLMNCPQLAEATGASLNMISYYVSGKKTPSLKTLGKIAQALEVDVTELIED